jgi:hypothetical protein
MPKEHAVIVIGRFQPPTAGHHLMVQHAIDLANAHDADHIIYGSKSEGDADNPLPTDVKRKHMMRIFGTDSVVVDKNLKDAIAQLKHAHDLGYRKLTLVAGGSRANQYENFRKYFGKKNVSEKTGAVLDLRGIRPENFNVVGLPRDPDSDAGKLSIGSGDFDPKTGKMKIAKVSGSLVRSAADSGDFDLFHSMMPSHVSTRDSRELMSDLATHMKKLRTEELHPIAGKLLNEVVSAQTRVKLARAARRTAKRRAMLRKLRSKKRKTNPQLQKRAKQHVKDVLRKRVFKGNWKKLSYSQRANIDARINKKKRDISSMVRRIMPEVVRDETKRLQRLQGLTDSFNPVVDNFLQNFLSEARTPKRPEKDSEGKKIRRDQNRENKRNQRERDETKMKAGDFKGTIMVVKNDIGDIEIIDKESYNPEIHDVVVAADKATRGNVSKFVKDADFVNTETSKKLFGLIKKGAGKGKTKEKAKEEPKKEKKESSKDSSSGMQELPQQLVPATKKASKKDTFATSHGATEMESGIVYALNSMLGLTPQQMIEKGLIEKKDLDAAMQNPNESFLPSCQRAAQQILKQFGKVYIKHTGRLKKETKLNKEAKDNGVTDKTPKSDLLLVDDKGTVVATLSQKIGNSQLSSGGPAETITNLKWSMAQVADKLEPSAKKQIEKFIKFFEDELSGNPRTKKGPVSLYQKGSAREGQDEEVARRERLHDKATEMLNTVLNGDKNLAKAFVYSLLTGQSKFEEGSPSAATHIFSANRDGTDAKITPITMDYCEKILDKVKFQMKFKSSAVETTDVKKKWAEFEERKKKLGEEVSPEEDFRQYSFRSVIRSYLFEQNSFRKKLLNMIIENAEENKLKNVVAKEPTNPEEALQYLKDAFEYIGDDGFKLIQFFEDSIDFDTTQPIIDWSEYASVPSTTTNKIYVNGKEFEIPVEEPYNYEDNGSMSSPLSEAYLEEKKRNYRKEYDNYHSKPEQRKNRSRRVLARRLMTKLGRVRKGDGKDVDHKDGNPQNNGKHNLRVRNKSENRADNG